MVQFMRIASKGQVRSLSVMKTTIKRDKMVEKNRLALEMNKTGENQTKTNKKKLNRLAQSEECATIWVLLENCVFLSWLGS